MQNIKKYKLLTIKLLGFLFIISCSSTPENPDPHKEFNEDMLQLNLTLDKNILKPTAETYKEITIDPMQKGISNFLNNLNEPFYCINYVLTGNAEKVLDSVLRFVFNSTFGIFGLFDIADNMNIPKSTISHKDTLKKWKVPNGDYLVLPIFGASSTRDAIAEPISWFMNPINYFIGVPCTVAKSIVQMISDRAENANLIDSTIKNSMNIYTTLKSTYQQQYGIQDNNIIDEDLLEKYQK